MMVLTTMWVMLCQYKQMGIFGPNLVSDDSTVNSALTGSLVHLSPKILFTKYKMEVWGFCGLLIAIPKYKLN